MNHEGRGGSFGTTNAGVGLGNLNGGCSGTPVRMRPGPEREEYLCLDLDEEAEVEEVGEGVPEAAATSRSARRTTSICIVEVVKP